MADSRLHRLSARGQSVWIDYLSRDMLAQGELARMMEEDAVVGVTSNPTIFQKAISHGSAYDEQLEELLVQEADLKEVFLQLAVRDVEAALDLLAPVHERSPEDGYVSLEVDPTLAYDAEATFDEALRLHTWIDRPNLLVKIPATKPGLGAIEDCIARGRSINVTLIFSLERYREVAEAYLRGLERLVASGGSPARVRSVASFFVSRVDTEADKRLEAIGGESAKVDLDFGLTENAGRLSGSIQYATDLFDAETIDRLVGHWGVLLEAIVADPGQRISQLPLLTEAERHQLLVQWNDTAVEYPRDRCIHQLFEAQVERSPGATALVYEDQQLTYGELNARANRLAHHLRSLGVGPGVLVGVCLERSLELVVGLLAILKAGGAYVPLDPSYPAERLAFMLQDPFLQSRYLKRIDRLIELAGQEIARTRSQPEFQKLARMY